MAGPPMPATVRLGVLADTHLPTRARSLPPILFAAFAGVDAILHAGDLCTLAVLIELEAIAPVYAVYGNVDGEDVRRRLPGSRLLTFGAHRIGLVHGDGPGRIATPERARAAFTEADIIVFGHSHQPYNRRVDGVLLFNPGSPTDRRFEPQCTYGTIVLGREVTAEIHPVPPTEGLP